MSNNEICKCPLCGAHVPKSIAVTGKDKGKLVTAFCSVKCAQQSDVLESTMDAKPQIVEHFEIFRLQFKARISEFPKIGTVISCKRTLRKAA